MPKRTTGDDEMPRRRRRSAPAGEAGSARGLALRLVLKSPKDTIAGLLAFSATSAIVTNALFLQTGPHPAPMFGSFAPSVSSAASISSPLPRPRPAEADSAESKPAEPKLSEPRLAETKGADPLANLVRTTTGSVSSANVMRPPAPIPPGSHGEGNSAAAVRRVAAVQRALTEYGYGQLKPTGTVGADTQAAIQKFERERKLPVTGQISDRVVHELAVVIGHPVD